MGRSYLPAAGHNWALPLYDLHGNPTTTCYSAAPRPAPSWPRSQQNKMTSQQVFGLQVVLSFVVYGLVAKWYLSPRLASLPLPAALQPLLVLHAFRHLGMVFLVPTVVGPALPASFAVPAAYGDLLAGLLALASILALRGRSPIASRSSGSSAWSASWT